MQLAKFVQLLGKSESIRSITGEKEVLGIANDSRKTKQGFMFVAINGHKLDGHDYVSDAINRGAIAIVTERVINNIDNQVDQIVVENARKALSELSNYFYCQPSKKIKTLGVTGTNGKTTTTHLIKSILEYSLYDSQHLGCITTDDAYYEERSQVGLIGTIGYIVGKDVLPARETTPESVDLHNLLSQMVRLKLPYAVMEVSSQSLVQYRTNDVDFSAATFTNLTPEHLDYHRDFAGYRSAKARLFERLNSNAFAILNADDDAGNYFAKSTKANVIWYGIKNNADVRCRILNYLPDSTDIVLSYNNDEVEIRLPMIGLHNVYNALAAATNGIVCGLDLETIRKGISAFNNVPGRLERIDCGQNFKVFVDYAHTSHALDAVLQSLNDSKFSNERLLLVFGCGGDRDRGKRPKMGKVADKFADRFWITNDNPRSEDYTKIISEIKNGLKSSNSYSVQPDRRLAIKEAITEATEKDIVLIAGKGHETGQIIGDKVFEFSDKEVAKEMLMELRGQ